MSLTKADPNKQGWEDSVRTRFNLEKLKKKNIHCCNYQEFPIVCETCLGDNPYVRMVMKEKKESKTNFNTNSSILQTKQPFGKECKVNQQLISWDLEALLD